jgi:glucosamine--fructose-6-phosphate aminotransferase (isomerizing)
VVTSRIEADIFEQPDAWREVLADPAIASAGQRVRTAGMVRLVGLGSSRHAAGYGAACIEALARRPAMVMAAPAAGFSAPPVGPMDVAVIVSQSGETPILCEVAARFRAAGAAVIAVTNAGASSLAAAADVALDCHAGPERVVAATKSVTATMVALRCLAEAPVDERQGRLLGALDALLAAPLPEALPGVPDAVVWGGVAAEWMAEEVALKYAEVAGRVVAAESVVEFLHGPAAARPDLVGFFDPSDPNFSLMGAFRPWRIGSDPAADLVVPTVGDETLEPLLRLVAAQRLVVAQARAAGEDPDEARGLTKVTTTS